MSIRFIRVWKVIFWRAKRYFGFIRESSISEVYPNSFEFTEEIQVKLDYLKSLDAQETDRRTSIETKISQMIGQTGIIFSILSLFMSTYFAKLKDWLAGYQVVVVIVFLISLFFYLTTIFKGIKYLNISKYKYGQRNTTTVQRKFNSKDDFLAEEVKDLIYSINRNTKITNLKVDNLVYAYRSFRVGTFTVAFLSVLLLASGYFPTKKEVSKSQIENPILVKGIDTSDTITNKSNLLKYDSGSGVRKTDSGIKAKIPSHTQRRPN